MNLTVALNYGGRDEVFRATKRLAQDVADGKLSPDAINEETLPKYLDTQFLPDQIWSFAHRVRREFLDFCFGNRPTRNTNLLIHFG